ncbi:hypothetical protein PTSG_05772 [Salpingoeca rosetta]|uniref:Uncharacterized protein n=1 Tax=Salpingoeca rosetta (strain ATCC 50818 / BSB-021) TaxID=946362 RepID=F2UB67_SALR5|nr:uncharacterized protein PTSG_05772 [Salpingoeca rosetta]EGD74080.1 hypothetical protein PTSG_05772 [Salpingoeca rosetta]|eukprot:XP_004993642.1 hypothetical protein PTSG_05772 [Salpingoeca rosetta]
MMMMTRQPRHESSDSSSSNTRNVSSSDSSSSGDDDVEDVDDHPDKRVEEEQSRRPRARREAHPTHKPPSLGKSLPRVDEEVDDDGDDDAVARSDSKSDERRQRKRAGRPKRRPRQQRQRQPHQQQRTASTKLEGALSVDIHSCSALPCSTRVAQPFVRMHVIAKRSLQPASATCDDSSSSGPRQRRRRQRRGSAGGPTNDNGSGGDSSYDSAGEETGHSSRDTRALHTRHKRKHMFESKPVHVDPYSALRARWEEQIRTGLSLDDCRPANADAVVVFEVVDPPAVNIASVKPAAAGSKPKGPRFDQEFTHAVAFLDMATLLEYRRKQQQQQHEEEGEKDGGEEEEEQQQRRAKRRDRQQRSGSGDPADEEGHEMGAKGGVVEHTGANERQPASSGSSQSLTLPHLRLQLYRLHHLTWLERLRRFRRPSGPAGALDTAAQPPSSTSTSSQLREPSPLPLRPLSAFYQPPPGMEAERFGGYLDVSIRATHDDSMATAAAAAHTVEQRAAEAQHNQAAAGDGGDNNSDDDDDDWNQHPLERIPDDWDPHWDLLESEARKVPAVVHDPLVPGTQITLALAHVCQYQSGGCHRVSFSNSGFLVAIAALARFPTGANQESGGGGEDAPSAMKEQHVVHVYGVSGVSQQRQPFLIQEYRAHTGIIYNIDWTPDDTCFLTCSADGFVCLWDAVTFSPQPLAVLPHSSFVYDARFLRTSAHHEHTRARELHTHPVVDDSDGESASDGDGHGGGSDRSDRDGGGVVPLEPPGHVGGVFRASQRRRRQRRRHGGDGHGGGHGGRKRGALAQRVKQRRPVDTHALAEAVQVVTAAYDGLVRVWELRAQRQRRLTLSLAHSLRTSGQLEGAVVCETRAGATTTPAISSDQQQQQGQQQSSGGLATAPVAAVNALAIDRRHTRVFAGDASGRICVWLVDTSSSPSAQSSSPPSQVLSGARELRDPEMRGFGVTSVVLDSSERRLICLSRDATIRFINLTNMLVDQKIHVGARQVTGMVRCCLSPCGRLLFAGGDDGRVLCWYTDTGLACRTQPALPTK